MLNGMPRIHKAKMPPMADNGIAVKINSDCFTELKVKYSKIKISPNAIGTATIKRLFASIRFSNCPPYVV
ncbi:hypothetical protein D9M72_609300 [compost metagenome]